MPRIDHNARRRARHGKNRANSSTTIETPTPRTSPTDSMRARSVGRVVLAGPKEPRKPTTTNTPEKTMEVGKPGYNRKTVEVKDKTSQTKSKRKGPPGKRR